MTHKASLALQTSADVLLLLQWNNEKDAGNIPAKFYEYLGARRPILFLGYEQGDLAATIRERAVGVVANDPAAIARQLRTMDRAEAGRASRRSTRSARVGLTRDEQNQKYEGFLKEVAARPIRQASGAQRAISTGRFASMMMWRVAPPKIIWRMRLCV